MSSMLSGAPSKTTIEGYDPLRTYIEDAPRRAGEIRLLTSLNKGSTHGVA
jgi:hypothetical protein